MSAAGSRRPSRRITVMDTWREKAACRGMDPALWFPATRYPKGEELERARQALRVCRSCPVWLDCLEWAVLHRERGIWGGMDEEGRRRSKLGKKIRASGGRRRVHADA